MCENTRRDMIRNEDIRDKVENDLYGGQDAKIEVEVVEVCEEETHRFSMSSFERLVMMERRRGRGKRTRYREDVIRHDITLNRRLWRSRDKIVG